jgi:hypothetical protein
MLKNLSPERVLDPKLDKTFNINGLDLIAGSSYDS